MSQEKRLKVKLSELPLLMDLEGPNGEQAHFQLLPKKKKGEIGMFLNAVPEHLSKHIQNK